MAEEQEKKRTPMSLGRILILGIACAVFLYSGSQLLAYFTENRDSEQAQQELIDQAVVVLPPAIQPDETVDFTVGEWTAETVPSTEVPTETAPIYVDFDTLQEQNSDIVGWIYSEDTKINYPIVQGVSNQQYLYRTHTGQRNANGSIFMDFRNLPDFSDLNNIVYGHNMANGAMFGTLRRYMDQTYFEEHPVMWLLTPDKAFRVDVIAGLVTPSDSEIYELFSYIEDLQENVRYAISKSTFDPGEVDIEQVKQVVTLSTCSYEYATARYVVIGNLVEVAYPEAPVPTETTEP